MRAAPVQEGRNRLDACGNQGVQRKARWNREETDADSWGGDLSLGGAQMGGISELVRRVSEIRNLAEFAGHSIYFRGQRKQDKLLPHLMRHSDKMRGKKENNLYCNCWVMGCQEFRTAHNSWEVLGIMQHHGIPTRLLDWTSSLINAVYFAICDCQDCEAQCHKRPDAGRREGCHGNPVVWLLAPKRMHEFLASPPNLTAFTIGIDSVQDYAEVFVRTNTQEIWNYQDGPIFVEIPWNDPRMKSQKGYFTFHADDRPLEEIRPESVRCIEIDNEWKSEILDEFDAMGISEYDVFADLESLSRHLRRSYAL